MENIIYKYPNYIYRIYLNDGYFCFTENGNCQEPDRVNVYSDMDPVELINYLESRQYILLSNESNNKHRIIPIKEILNIHEDKAKQDGERKYTYNATIKYKPNPGDKIFAYKLITK